MKYLSQYYALHAYDLDWKHPYAFCYKVYQKTNKLLGDYYIDYKDGDFYARPSRAFVDLLLSGLYSKTDLIKYINNEFSIEPDVAFEMLEMLWKIYLNANRKRKLSFRNTQNSFDEFQSQLGKTFNKKFAQEIVDFKAKAWME